MKIRDPAVGKYYEDFLFKRNWIDESFDKKYDNIDEIVKFYPGGPNGPLPEDNPDHYSEWFFKNQPHDLIYGEGENGQPKIVDYKDIGVKWKWVWQKKVIDDSAMSVEYQDQVSNMIE